MGKIVPIVLALLGMGAGVGAGIALRPAPEPPQVASTPECPDEPNADCVRQDGEIPVGENAGAEGNDPAREFVKMNNQFVVPVVSDEKVAALVVMSLSLEVTPGGSEAFYQREPKLRDAFLQVLFDHANAGGFDGVFTSGRKLDSLRRALLEMARNVMGEKVTDVLVTDILRQDV